MTFDARTRSKALGAAAVAAARRGIADPAYARSLRGTDQLRAQVREAIAMACRLRGDDMRHRVACTDECLDGADADDLRWWLGYWQSIVDDWTRATVYAAHTIAGGGER